MKHSSKRKRSSTGKRRQTRHEQPVAPLGDTISEYTRKVKTSKATAYRRMADGSLRYVMVGKQRRIPCTEYVRIGLVPAEQGTAPSPAARGEIPIVKVGKLPRVPVCTMKRI